MGMWQFYIWQRLRKEWGCDIPHIWRHSSSSLGHLCNLLKQGNFQNRIILLNQSPVGNLTLNTKHKILAYWPKLVKKYMKVYSWNFSNWYGTWTCQGVGWGGGVQSLFLWKYTPMFILQYKGGESIVCIFLVVKILLIM